MLKGNFLHVLHPVANNLGRHAVGSTPATKAHHQVDNIPRALVFPQAAIEIRPNIRRTGLGEQPSARH